MEVIKRLMISILNRIMFNKGITEHGGIWGGILSKSLILLGDRAGCPPGGSAWGVAGDIVNTHPISLFQKNFNSFSNIPNYGPDR
jgi:hypothetical protein